jgi:hypothetical protein
VPFVNSEKERDEEVFYNVYNSGIMREFRHSARQGFIAGISN